MCLEGCIRTKQHQRRPNHTVLANLNWDIWYIGIFFSVNKKAVICFVQVLKHVQCLQHCMMGWKLHLAVRQTDRSVMCRYFLVLCWSVIYPQGNMCIALQSHRCFTVTWEHSTKVNSMLQSSPDGNGAALTLTWLQAECHLCFLTFSSLFIILRTPSTYLSRPD